LQLGVKAPPGPCIPPPAENALTGGWWAQVIIVEDENGQIVRESMKDNDVLTQYRTMRETLIYLSHLDHDDTEQQMVAKLRQQVRRPRAAQGRTALLACCCACELGILQSQLYETCVIHASTG
jgi:hypothetical protein